MFEDHDLKATQRLNIDLSYTDNLKQVQKIGSD
jgi:hypothetical protein